jgi:DNA-directed RNA polymerase subunit RPC12/RpoP
MLRAEFNLPDNVQVGPTSWAIVTYTCSGCGNEWPVELVLEMDRWDYGPSTDDRCPRCGRSGSETEAGGPDIFDLADEAFDRDR